MLSAKIASVDRLPRITLSGDLEGDYVVLAERGGGVLRIAPARQDALPTVAALRTNDLDLAPTQWEGDLEDGRTLFAHCRRGELSVGVGDSVNDAAIGNTAADKALCFRSTSGSS